MDLYFAYKKDTTYIWRSLLKSYATRTFDEKVYAFRSWMDDHGNEKLCGVVCDSISFVFFSAQFTMMEVSFLDKVIKVIF